MTADYTNSGNSHREYNNSNREFSDTNLTANYTDTGNSRREFSDTNLTANYTDTGNSRREFSDANLTADYTNSGNSKRQFSDGNLSAHGTAHTRESGRGFNSRRTFSERSGQMSRQSSGRISASGHTRSSYQGSTGGHSRGEPNAYGAFSAHGSAYGSRGGNGAPRQGAGVRPSARSFQSSSFSVRSGFSEEDRDHEDIERSNSNKNTGTSKYVAKKDDDSLTSKELKKRNKGYHNPVELIFDNDQELVHVVEETSNDWDNYGRGTAVHSEMYASGLKRNGKTDLEKKQKMFARLCGAVGVLLVVIIMIHISVNTWEDPYPLPELPETPSTFRAFADISDEYPDPSSTLVSKNAPRDVPVVWYLPMTGGELIHHVLGSCHGLTLASDLGTATQNDEGLAKITEKSISFVNVDTTTVAGLHHAKGLKLAQSPLPHVIFSPLKFDDLKSLFSAGSNQGRLLMMVRHPVLRAISVHYYGGSKLSLDEYSKSPEVQNNYLTRFLTGKIGGTLDETHVQTAKDIMAAKFVVGIYHNLDASLQRFEDYFHWKAVGSTVHCRDDAILRAQGLDTGIAHLAEQARETEAWTYLSYNNRFDMELYTYSKKLFREQKQMFRDLKLRRGEE
eukprot:CAMPEP_0194395360 /NCGR_PEP_ID=MMETSP0174-20130528/124378_1 /TAXON_ID=216777 /ORGANISM="Proboscia alata, Strain PI-D3" /LENGTH=619 /DNA_ID=CAMNT_0039191283 /DNA_START=280 /DNA_END=2139 /DNA_ORIENTATION=-